jgi:hypothetical protein
MPSHAPRQATAWLSFDVRRKNKHTIMQVSPRIVNWNRLLEYGDADGLSKWVMTLEEYPSWFRPFELYTDGAPLYLEIGGALAEHLGRASSAEPLIVALASLICTDEKLKIEDFPCPPESCYVTAASPQGVQKLRDTLESASEAEWQYVYEILASCESPSEVHEYLTSVRRLVIEAANGKDGIIIHMG